MQKLKTGGSRRSVTALTASPSRKRDIFSNMGRDLTPSEIALLKQDVKRVNDEIDRLIANDPRRRQPQAA